MAKPKSRAIVMITCAVLLAGGSIYLTQTWLDNQTQPVVENQAKIETTKVVIASSRLANGNKLQEVHLSVVDWPTSLVPEGSFSTIEDVLGKDSDNPEKRIVLRSIEINEPILKSRITGFGGRASLSALIAPGMRASTIRVNDVNGVAGFVLPGDHVDIMFTRADTSNTTGGRSNRKNKNLQTDIFLQNMKVLAIDQDSNEQRDKPSVSKSVTLEVTPVQAQKLILAMQIGKLSLSLRNVNTVDAEEVRTIKARDLGFTDANVAPTPKTDKVKVVKASKATTVSKGTKPAHSHSSKTVVKRITPEVVTIVKKKHMVNIVRGLKGTEYEVMKQEPTFSEPAFSKPLELMEMSPLAPAVPLVPQAPMATAPLNLLAPTAPMALAHPNLLAPTLNIIETTCDDADSNDKC